MSGNKENLDERFSLLQAEIQTCGEDIMKHIKGLYSSQDVLIDLKNDPKNVLKMLKSDLIDLLKTARSRSEYLKKYESDILACENLMSVVGAVADSSDKIAQCEEVLSSSDLKSGCTAIAAVEQSLKLLPPANSEWGSGSVCTTLRREGNMLKFRFQSRLRRLYNACIIMDKGRISIHKNLKGMVRGEEVLIETPISLSAIFSALLSAGGIDDVIQSLQNQLWNHIIRPLWKEKKFVIPHSTNGADESTLLFESIARDSADEKDDDTSRLPPSCRMALPALLDDLSAVFTFITTECFDGDSNLVGLFAKRLCTPPISLGRSLATTLCASFPKTEQELATLQRSLEKPVREFEQRFLSLGLSDALVLSTEDASVLSVPPSTSADAPLSALVADLPGIFADFKRREVLSRARDLLLADYHNCMLASGDARDDTPASAGAVGDERAMLGLSGGMTAASSVLRFESCLVSLASCRLLRLMHEVLEQACVSSPRLANVLYQSSRDCLELFLAVVPLRFCDVIESVPRMGALFYNDCVYIAHNCTILTHTYHLALAQADPSLQGCVGFVDFLTRFRTAGDRCLTGHVEGQQKSIAELMDKIRLSPTRRDGGDAVDGQTESFCNNDDAAAVVVRHFDRLRGQWQEALQETVYERIIGYLMEGVARTVISTVLQAEIISEAAALQIAKIIRTLAGIRTSVSRLDDDLVTSVAGSWTKLLALQQLLEFSLTEIAEALHRRKLATFTANELSGLVKTLFEESPRRQNIISVIMQMTG